MATLNPARPPSTGTVDVMLVDDHAIVRQGLRSILEREGDLRVVGEASTAETALAEVAGLVIEALPQVRQALNGAGLPCPASLALAAEKARNALAASPVAR